MILATTRGGTGQRPGRRYRVRLWWNDGGTSVRSFGPVFLRRAGACGYRVGDGRADPGRCPAAGGEYGGGRAGPLRASGLPRADVGSEAGPVRPGAIPASSLGQPQMQSLPWDRLPLEFDAQGLSALRPRPHRVLHRGRRSPTIKRASPIRGFSARQAILWQGIDPRLVVLPTGV